MDLSKYQGDGGAHGPAPDWATIPPLELMSAKASQGVTELDPSFSHNWAGARAAGVRWRFANHFPSLAPIGDQIAQLERALVAAGSGGLDPGEGVALDIEPDAPAGIPSLPPAFAVELAGAFAAHFGRPAVLDYQGYFQPSWRALTAAGHPWWLPWPNAQLGVDSTGRRWFGPDVIALVSAWQYGQGLVPGIAGLVDLDRSVNPAELDRATGLTPDPPPEVSAMSTTVVRCSDADAVFEGEMSEQGILTFVRWIDGAREAVLTGEPFNCPAISRAVAELAGMSLIGPLPTGDSRHAWTGAEFYRWQAPPAPSLAPHRHDTPAIPAGSTGDAIPS